MLRSWLRVLGAVTHEPRDISDESDMSVTGFQGCQGTSWAHPAWCSSFLRCLVSARATIRFRQMLLQKLAAGSVMLTCNSCRSKISTLASSSKQSFPYQKIDGSVWYTTSRDFSLVVRSQVTETVCQSTYQLKNKNNKGHSVGILVACWSNFHVCSFLLASLGSFWLLFGISKDIDLPHWGKVSLQVFQLLLGFLQLMGNVPVQLRFRFEPSETGRTEKYVQKTKYIKHYKTDW